MRIRNVVTAGIVITMLGMVAVKLLVRSPSSVQADPEPDQLRLFTVVRDFPSSHPDFNITDPAEMGHHAMNVASTLPVDRRPTYSGGGMEVDEQWFDKDGNPIMPYVPETDPGLPGGHFDVDVFDEVTDKELYHQHKYDDKFDVTYVDLVNDERLLLADVVPDYYPNDLRVEFFNPHHASGTYTFQAGGAPQTGPARNGFTTTFNRASLTQFRVDFAWLLELRGTSPGTVQKDIENRDDAFAIRMYDVTNDALVYELAIYHHGEEGSLELPDTFNSTDDCGGSIADSIGTFGDPAGGAVDDDASYGQWYRDVPGTNLSMPNVLTLDRNYQGIYEYQSSSFYPIDGALLDDGDTGHNHFYTVNFKAKFTYSACNDWFFEFEGNDDAWVYIDNKLVIDIGGVATPSRQHVSLDRLGLVDGQEYTFDFFYAHRRAALDSVFNMRTNIPLTTSGSVPVSGQYD